MTEGQAINILKRVIEYLSAYRSFDREQDQQDALEIANVAIESLFASMADDWPNCRGCGSNLGDEDRLDQPDEETGICQTCKAKGVH